MPRRPASPPADLGDGVVVLRARRESDHEAVRAGQRDPAVRRWLEDPVRAHDTPAASVARARHQWESGRGTPFVVADAHTDAPLGLVNLRLTDAAALVATSVFASARGRGVAPRAVRLLIGWAFAELGESEVRYETDARNAASIRVAEKLGLRRLGERTEPGDDGATVTTVVHGVTAAQWRASA